MPLPIVVGSRGAALLSTLHLVSWQEFISTRRTKLAPIKPVLLPRDGKQNFSGIGWATLCRTLSSLIRISDAGSAKDFFVAQLNDRQPVLDIEYTGSAFQLTRLKTLEANP